MAVSRLVVALAIGLVLLHPPLILGLAFGSEGKKWGEAIEAALGTDQLRQTVFGRK